MININCLNAISKVGLAVLTNDYKIVDEYRKMMRQEHAWFSKDVKDIFGLLTSS